MGLGSPATAQAWRFETDRVADHLNQLRSLSIVLVVHHRYDYYDLHYTLSTFFEGTAIDRRPRSFDFRIAGRVGEADSDIYELSKEAFKRTLCISE
jgi:hypothetical protein